MVWPVSTVIGLLVFDDDLHCEWWPTMNLKSQRLMSAKAPESAFTATATAPSSDARDSSEDVDSASVQNRSTRWQGGMSNAKAPPRAIKALLGRALN